MSNPVKRWMLSGAPGSSENKGGGTGKSISNPGGGHAQAEKIDNREHVDDDDVDGVCKTPSV